MAKKHDENQEQEKSCMFESMEICMYCNEPFCLNIQLIAVEEEKLK